MIKIIKIQDLKIFDKRNREIIVDKLSFNVKQKTCLAIVGESGSGKSMTVKTINKTHRPWIEYTGEILFDGRDILKMSKNQLRNVRGKDIFMIFQDAMSAFDPSTRIGNSCIEILTENIKTDKKSYKDLLINSMEKVLLKDPDEILKKYPHQLSGGMLQRVIISLALVLKPKLIIVDEPTTALDTISQYEVVDQFKKLQKELNTTMIFISHDLGVVRNLADYVVLMKDGHKVEEAPTEDIFNNPQSNYAKHLIGTRKILAKNFNELMRRGT